MTEAEKPAGKVRYSIVAMLFLASMVNYGDRSVLSIAAPALSQEMHIDSVQLGFVFSAFGWAYVLAQIPGGWLLDRFGSFRVYFWSILLWSVMTAAQGLLPWLVGVSAVGLLFTFRFLVGLAEAPAFPGNARIVATWFPATERGTASAIFNASQYFATVAFAPIFGWLVHTTTWYSVFWFMGVVGVLLCFAWPRFMYEPRKHPRLGKAELDKIVEGGGAIDMDSQASASKISWSTVRVMLTNRTSLGLYIGQYAINTLTYFFITWFPVYLVKERGLSIIQAGAFATVPAICGFAGGVLGGIWSDWMLRQGKSLTFARKTPIVAGMLGSLAILGCNYSDAPWQVMVFMSLAFFGKGVGALGWAVMADTAPRGMAGISGGIFNTCGNLSSIVTPIAVGFLVSVTGGFAAALVFVAANALLAVAAFLFIVGDIRRIELPTPAAPAAGPTSR